jgi:hypothetical protein
MTVLIILARYLRENTTVRINFLTIHAVVRVF